MNTRLTSRVSCFASLLRIDDVPRDVCLRDMVVSCESSAEGFVARIGNPNLSTSHHRSLLAILVGILLGLVLFLWAAIATAQVPLRTTMERGYASIPVSYHERDSVDVEVVLLTNEAIPKNGGVEDTIPAIITPSTFTLGNGDSQTVRVLCGECVEFDPGTIVRLAVKLIPKVPEREETIAFIVARRVLVKVEVQ